MIAGANKYGQLGRGDKYDTGDDPDEMGNNLVTVSLGGGEVAADIALAEEHTCVVLKSGGTKVRMEGVPAFGACLCYFSWEVVGILLLIYSAMVKPSTQHLKAQDVCFTERY